MNLVDDCEAIWVSFRRLNWIVFAAALFLTLNVHAQDEVSDDEALHQMLELLDEQTSLATQTRMNADFVPGMLSVIATEELLSRGFRTVWDALATIPGVLPSTNSTGMRSLSVRGVGNIFESSKIKLLLNGKALNISASNTTVAIYDIPVQQVERIEFIRGPGSAVHGEFAYAGVLNVVTRKNDEFYSFGLDSGGGYLVSGLKAFNLADSGRANLNISLQSSDGEDLDSGDDRSAAALSGNAPGPVNNKRDMLSVIFDVEVGEFNAGVQYQELIRGDYFGINNLLPPDKKQTVISESVLSAYVGQTIDVGDNLVTEWSINALQNTQLRNQLFLGSAESFGGLVGDDDVVTDSELEERRIEANLSVRYSGARHDLFTELVLSDVRVTESEQFFNLDPVTLLPTTLMHEFPGLVDDSLDRSAFSLVIQDQFHINSQTTLTTGVRYDDYEDIGGNASPRIALVRRESDQHVFKAQLARAFRPPSLIEVGGTIQSTIDSEAIDTVELGYIYNDHDLTIRNTLYHSKLTDLIVFSDTAPLGYLNSSSRRVKGYELEVEDRLTTDLRLWSSLTIQDDDSDKLTSVASWIVKLGLQYRLSPSSSLHFQLNSVSERERSAGDSRSDFGRTDQANISATFSRLGDVPGLSLRFGIDNILDEDISFISSENTYADDYIYSDDPFFWIQILFNR